MRKVTKGSIAHTSNEPTDDRPEYLVSADDKYTIALDTETTGLDWSNPDEPDWPFMATISDYDRDYLYKLDGPDKEKDTEELRQAILRADRLIFHNAAFDIHQIVRSGIMTMDEMLSKEIHDTDLLARCVLGTGNGPFGLKPLAERFVDKNAGEPEKVMKQIMLDMGLIKTLKSREMAPGAYRTVWLAYPEVMERYALKDTRYTYDLYYTLLEQANEDALKVYALEMELLPVVVQMEHVGVRTDSTAAQVLQVDYDHRLQEAYVALTAMAGDPEFNPGSTTQAANFLLQQGVSLYETNDSGEFRLDKYALGKVRSQNPEAVDLLLEWRQTSKFLSTYLSHMHRPSVHTSFWQIGANTGRMSSSKPNVQNIPVRGGTELRDVFIPREGMCFVDCDFSSIELRVLSYYMADPAFKEIVESGKAFEWLGEQVYGTPDQSEWPVARQSLKNGFYALTYGAGGPRLAATIGGGMTDAEGRKLASRIKGTLGPRYRGLNNALRASLRQRGYIADLGRRRHEIDTEKAYLALNYLIQGSASYIMKRALVEADKVLRDLGGYPVLVIHDEILAEVPIEKADEAFTALKSAMETATSEIPMVVEGKVCYNSFGEAK